MVIPGCLERQELLEEPQREGTTGAAGLTSTGVVQGTRVCPAAVEGATSGLLTVSCAAEPTILTGGGCSIADAGWAIMAAIPLVATNPDSYNCSAICTP